MVGAENTSSPRDKEPTRSLLGLLPFVEIFFRLPECYFVLLKCISQWPSDTPQLRPGFSCRTSGYMQPTSPYGLLSRCIGRGGQMYCLDPSLSPSAIGKLCNPWVCVHVVCSQWPWNLHGPLSCSHLPALVAKPGYHVDGETKHYFKLAKVNNINVWHTK